MPPAIHSRMSVSALGSILADARSCRGAPPASARNVAPAESCMKCRRFIGLPDVLKLGQQEDGPKQVLYAIHRFGKGARQLQLLRRGRAPECVSIQALRIEFGLLGMHRRLPLHPD